MSAKQAAYRKGLYVLIGLVILTIAEVILARTAAAAIAILVIDVIQAGMIAYYFMHIYRLWSQEAH